MFSLFCLTIGVYSSIDAITRLSNDFDIDCMRFIGRILHNVTFHDNFARFSYVHSLQREVEEIMQITCPAFHVHPMSSKFALTDSYMYQKK